MMHSRYFIGNGSCFGAGIFGGIWGWLIVIGVVLLITAVVYLLVSKNKKTAVNASALETLDTKFAQGEVTIEEYQKRKSVLTGK
ncbi:MAG: SHOCT domain-containing protein [Clostridiales bacterium]|nr:SHOCT domain-containing protein [Clostridiales bacterium]